MTISSQDRKSRRVKPSPLSPRLRQIAKKTAEAVSPHHASFLRLNVEERQLYAVAIADFAMAHEDALHWVALASFQARLRGCSIFDAAEVLSPLEQAPHSKLFQE